MAHRQSGLISGFGWNRCARCGNWPFASQSRPDEDWRSWYRDDAPGCPRMTIRNCHMHHIIAVQDKGDDKPENLIPLCTNCHHEWHDAEGHYEFRQWIGTIPIRWLGHLTNQIYSAQPPSWMKGFTLEKLVSVLKTSIFDEPSDAWFWQARDAFLDQHAAIYGDKPTSLVQVRQQEIAAKHAQELVP